MTKHQDSDVKNNLAILQEIIDTIGNGFDLKEILNNVAKIIGKITRADSCFIYLISGDEVILKA